MKLAELEAKAKALAGTQHWRGLDPAAVLEALGEVARLRVENAKNQIAINAHIETGMQFCHLASDAQAKLAKAHATLEWMDKVVSYASSWPWAKDVPLFGQIADRARQALKEIDE